LRGGRILWGQIAVVFTIVLVMTWAATQWVAFRLGFQPQLGNPWFELSGWPVYYPPAFFENGGEKLGHGSGGMELLRAA